MPSHPKFINSCFNDSYGICQSAEKKSTWGRVRRSSKRGVFFLNLILRRPHGEGWRESDSENLGHFSLTIYPRPRPQRFSAENFQRGFMFCKSLYDKGFCVKIKNARTRGLDGRRNENWGGRWDLNPRPPGPQPGALTNWATTTTNMCWAIYFAFSFCQA